MHSKKVRIVLLVLLFFSVVFFLERSIIPVLSSGTPSSFNILLTALQLIRNDYVEEPNPRETMEGAFKGMVDSLDILSSYLDEEDMEKFRLHSSGNLFETGIILYKRFGSFPVIIGIKEGSPAENESLKKGDLLSSIDDIQTVDMSMIEVNLALKNSQPTPVKLEIMKVNTKKEIEVQRTILHQKYFDFTSHTGTSGILKIHSFKKSFSDNIRAEIIPEIKDSSRPLIIDLRNCWEGEIEEALSFINIFLQADNIGFFRSKNQKAIPLSCPQPASLSLLPLIIWTNQATLGPAELAGIVLQEYRKATVVGTSTPGLIARQKLFPLQDGTGLLLTTSVYQLKPDQKFWMKGIEPSEEIVNSEASFQAYLEKTLNLIGKQ